MSSTSEVRRLGPFSGAQLTIIIVTFAVLLLFPVGAWAVAGSNVFVTDSGTGAHAFVSGAGQLNVTRAGAKSYVAASPLSISDSVEHVLLTPATGKALVITTLNYDVFNPISSPGVIKSIDFSVSLTDATCTSRRDVLFATPATLGPVNTPFDPGIVVPAHRALCVGSLGGNTLNVNVSAFGYSIPAAAAPVEAP